ncbi:uncharacterized protein Hap1MRO34_011303 isoform 1-T2 [Clarias gariepinus]|uniref:uncharacterized protein LOC128523760 n=1 Tax=Clarias gariepinus TaxID=13013 RepID=UPI00234DFF1C|nr:uncharacterized protein LOC128523760 [Clarias gariepinus]XP_053351867.1 uncharacterized protein LOC128523760 [Clarias gariepinus]XP_053351874.1 uncharacterized protein LOC128523760 [Clarias gariepinus]
MSSAGVRRRSSRRSRAPDPLPSQPCEDVKTKTSDGEVSTWSEVKKEETLELNISSHGSDLDTKPENVPIKEEDPDSNYSDAGLGVFNNGQTVPVGANLGAYQGELVDREEEHMYSGYSWGTLVETPSQTVVDLRPELEKRDAEIEELKQQLRVCKAAHVEEVEALKSKLRVCEEAHADTKAALADLEATHKGLVETHNNVITQLREAQTALTEAVRTGMNCAPNPTPDCLTPTGSNSSSGDAESMETSSATTYFTSCHPELPFTPPTTELLESLMIRSRGRPDRLGCLLFRTVVPQAIYEEWASTTNWDGSRGKRGLPKNLRHFLIETVTQKFPSLTSSDSKRVKDRVNEFLRSPRTTVAHRREQY